VCESTTANSPNLLLTTFIALFAAMCEESDVDRSGQRQQQRRGLDVAEPASIMPDVFSRQGTSVL
jgi:hypothetical protein